MAVQCSFREIQRDSWFLRGFYEVFETFKRFHRISSFFLRVAEDFMLILGVQGNFEVASGLPKFMVHLGRFQRFHEDSRVFYEISESFKRFYEVNPGNEISEGFHGSSKGVQVCVRRFHIVP